MINISEILFEICEDEHVYEPDFDLFESGLLDSFAFIELFAILEDHGIILHPTKIDRSRLRTPKQIDELVKEYIQEN